MLTLSSTTKVFVCSQAIDMRASFDGLSNLVINHFGVSPLCGHFFAFFSRRRNCMKILFWDIDGFVLYYKRLEGGTFSWVDRFQIDSTKEISRADFALILAGINPLEVKHPKRYKRSLELIPAN